MSQLRMTTGPGPFFVRSVLEFNKSTGWENVETWEGSENECRLKQAEMVSLGATRVKLSPKGDGNWSVERSFPLNKDKPQGNYVDTMELEVNAIFRSAYQSPVYRKKFSDVDPITGDSAKARSTLGPVGDCVRKYQSGLPKQETNGKYKYLGVEYATREIAVNTELIARLDAIPGLSNAEKLYAGFLFEEIAYMGATSCIEYNQVFRRPAAAGSPLAVRSNQVGARKIWTSAEVIAWENIPSDGWFDLPPDVQWHKDKPRVVKAYGQKSQLVYSYTQVVTATALH